MSISNDTNLNVLEITNNFGASPIYYNLFSHFDKLGLKQMVYVPLNYFSKSRASNVNFNFQINDSKVIYSPIMKLYHIVLYAKKIKYLYGDLKRYVKSNSCTNKFDIVYASTWCLDGALAYELKKEFNIPYVVCVRNTDINHYYKHFFYYRNYFKKILINAERIIFISTAYRLKTLNLLGDDFRYKLKSMVIQNGISDLYLNNRNIGRRSLHNPVKVVYVGGLLRIKNILRSCKAIFYLRSKGYEITFTVIGKGYGSTDKIYMNRVLNFSRKHNWVEVLPKMSACELVNVFKDYDIFLMPSIVETFGLVYIESLSQGLPIIFSKGQGIDGTFPDGFIGSSANSYDVKEIAQSVEYVIKNYSKLSGNILDVDFDSFSWKNVARKYLQLYASVIYDYNKC